MIEPEELFDGDANLVEFDNRVWTIRQGMPKDYERRAFERSKLLRDVLATIAVSDNVLHSQRLARLVLDEEYETADGTHHCPRCDEELGREEADVGVGVIYGPWGCGGCGWSSDPAYDSTRGPNQVQQAPPDRVIDQWGASHTKEYLDHGNSKGIGATAWNGHDFVNQKPPGHEKLTRTKIKPEPEPDPNMPGFCKLHNQMRNKCRSFWHFGIDNEGNLLPTPRGGVFTPTEDGHAVDCARNTTDGMDCDCNMEGAD